MENFLAVLMLSITPQTVFCFIGGILGGIFGAYKQKYPKPILIISVFASGIAGAGLGDYLLVAWHIKSLWGLTFLSIIADIPVGALMGAVEVASPSFSKRLVSKFETKIINKVG